MTCGERGMKLDSNEWPLSIVAVCLCSDHDVNTNQVSSARTSDKSSKEESSLLAFNLSRERERETAGNNLYRSQNVYQDTPLVPWCGHSRTELDQINALWGGNGAFLASLPTMLVQTSAKFEWLGFVLLLYLLYVSVHCQAHEHDTLMEHGSHFLF